MAQKKFIIKDESGDKNYFTIIPNYIANHSTSNDQSLYFQMKRLAGENGLCYATKSYFMKKMKIGYKSYKKSLNYLLAHKWISYSGKEKITTKGGIQEIDAYKINDIWRINNDFYSKGVVESIPPHSKGVVESTSKGVVESNPSKNIYKEEHIAVGKADSPFHRSIDYYLNQTKKVWGVVPEFNGGKDGKLLKSRLAKYGEDKVKKFIDYYLESEKCKKGTFNLSTALSADSINNYLKENEAYV